MAKKQPANRLKVFQAQFGFYDSIVAAPSQPAALRAWGTHQNLFAGGQASVATDAAGIEVALKHPNVPLRRAVGSNGAFAVEPTSVPVVPDAPKPTAATRASRVPKPQRQKPSPGRSALNAAVREVVDLDATRKVEEAVFRKRQSELDAEVEEAERRYEKRRRKLNVAVAAARKAYRDAGGKN